jgi:hypothetical protein
VRDTKTHGYQMQLEKIRVQGPPRQHRWQVNIYAAALIVAGHEVSEVELDYIARDSGNTYMWHGEFDYAAVAEATSWLANVRETPLDWLSRDYAPDSAHCKSCPFFDTCWAGHAVDRDPRSVLLVEDGDAIKWATLLGDALDRKHQAEEDEKKAKGALDALRPNTGAPSRGEVALEGFPWILRWTISATRRLNGEQIEDDYARAGASVPRTRGETVKLELIAPKLEEE